MASSAQERPTAATMLPADEAAAWMRHPIEDLLALSHRDDFPQQVAAPRHRFEQLRNRVSAPDKLLQRREPGADRRRPRNRVRGATTR